MTECGLWAPTKLSMCVCVCVSGSSKHHSRGGKRLSHTGKKAVTQKVFTLAAGLSHEFVCRRSAKGVTTPPSVLRGVQRNTNGHYLVSAAQLFQS